MENKISFFNKSKYYTTSHRRPFNIIEGYNLTKNKEKESISQINQLLKEFNIELDLLSLETTYYSIIPLGRKICENILKLLLNKEGYFVTEYVIFNETTQFCEKYDLIPSKQYQNLRLIRINANKAIHGVKPTNKNISSFLTAFNEFIEWFNSSYYENNIIQLNETNLKIKLNLNLLKNKKEIESEKISKYPQYSFYKQEESDDINQINKLLTDYEKQLKLISGEKKFYYTFTGSTITELMLKLLIKKEGYYNSNVHYTFFLYIDTLSQHKVIPKECENFLHLIRRYRNEFIHGVKQSNKLVISFLKAFNYFIQWYDNYYYLHYQNKFQIENCCVLINKLEYDEENKTIIFSKTKELHEINVNTSQINELRINQEIKEIKNQLRLKNEILKKETPIVHKLSKQSKQDLTEENEESKLNLQIKLLKEELISKEKVHQKQLNELKIENKKILKKLDEYGKLFGRCIDILEESNNREKRIESKIDNLHSKIDNISKQITLMQDLSERQIKNAQSKEEIERIIESYIETCIDNIMQYSANFIENQNYQMEKTKLIYSIGENGWNKLSEKSKTFLITSKVMYNHLITMHDIIDYSGICVLVTKALEVEIHKRFFSNFLDYLNRKYGKDYTKYHTALLFKNRKPLLSEKFTMGNFAFVMCYIENWNDTDEQKANNKLKLMEYCKECVFSNYSESEMEQLLTKYASSIEVIREKYRNPSAHTNEIKQVDAEECFNLVLDIEKLLKKMLDSFDE